jgi:hypothetical protein
MWDCIWVFIFLRGYGDPIVWGWWDQIVSDLGFTYDIGSFLWVFDRVFLIRCFEQG